MTIDSLSLVLSDFARTMVTDFPIQAILDRLVMRMVDVLPVSGAGVTLISPGMAPQYVAASNEAALRFERLQTEVGEGPCLQAVATGRSTLIPDLSSETRFPRFGPAAAASGMAAVFAFPLRHGTGVLGALDLYRDTTGPLTAKAMADAQTLADVVAGYLLNAQAREQALATSDQFRHGTLHDFLTGLANRELLAQRLEHAARRAERSHSSAAVLFADLDHFKDVNDTFGHAIGDSLLVAVAGRLTGAVRPGDTLARVSGDEFVIFCEDVADVSDVEALASRIGHAFDAPFSIAGISIVITASIGIAFAGAGEVVTSQLVADADVAMYEAKRRGGRSHQVADIQQSQLRNRRNQLSRDLQRAMNGAGLDLIYQPIVSVTDGATVGAEALVRWTHPDQGPVAAATTVQIAERTGLITRLGAWILDRACADHRKWRDQFPGRALDLSVNISPHQLLSADFPGQVADTLRRTGMDPATLILEITESMQIEDPDRGVHVLADLRSMGIRVALDGFGTGFSSLSYLRGYPMDVIKVDQGFVADMAQDPQGVAIVAAITQLAHALGLTVTAEGVDTRSQHDALSRVGCDLAQGSLYSIPGPLQEWAGPASQ